MFWSSELARVLCDALPDTLLATAWSTDAGVSASALRAELRESARTDEELRRWLWSAWRAQHAELVHATERLAMEELGAEAPGLLRAFAPELLLLAVLSEPGQDGAEDVELLLASTSAGRERKLLAAAWKRLQRDDSAAPGSEAVSLRLALVGGHPSERRRLSALEAAHGLSVDWIPAVKGKGVGPAQAALADLAGIQALLVVTGNVSHSVMHGARKAAQRLGVPCLFMERLTERCLGECLAGLRTQREPPGASAPASCNRPPNGSAADLSTT